MKICKLLIPLITLFSLSAYSQDGKQYFIDAYREQLAMIQGEKPIDFKRAVFLTENSYYKGKLNYQAYCTDISNIGTKLKLMIKLKGIEKYKTAGNWAAFAYMTDSSSVNNFKPYRYDFDDFMGDKDWTKQFITKLIKTHTGNCHSLPFLYKILCEQIGAKASLALGPNHVYIKHIDENGQWTNLELTSGSITRDQWIIKSMDIPIEAIKSGAYMAPLSEKECIAFTMFDLAETYNFQYGTDKFVLDIVNTAIRNFPTCIPLYCLKLDCCRELVESENKKPSPNKDYIAANVASYKETQAKVDGLGYKSETPESYKAFLQGMENEKKKRGLIKSN
ncbi:hypothetical protein [Mucilaginibacter paludis]|uniref:Protein SirB1 N-terminal domain-containing protein n=1 Tax=Mucilaginibacter paludis DSM 18603 TaxID=714943 RepID=H1XZG1_9SPHI|nr:hypothetical protein [Mucilaginibacter paludis]EHQ26605.1 hypothetical protein Mucpa_2490 [Mucilaginibacter paludis DSM 18603]